MDIRKVNESNQSVHLSDYPKIDAVIEDQSKYVPY